MTQTSKLTIALTAVLCALGAYTLWSDRSELAVVAFGLAAGGIALLLLRAVGAGTEDAVNPRRRRSVRRRKSKRSGIQPVSYDAARRRRSLAKQGVLAIDPETMAPPSVELWGEVSSPAASMPKVAEVAPIPSPVLMPAEEISGPLPAPDAA